MCDFFERNMATKTSAGNATNTSDQFWSTPNPNGSKPEIHVHVGTANSSVKIDYKEQLMNKFAVFKTLVINKEAQVTSNDDFIKKIMSLIIIKYEKYKDKFIGKFPVCTFPGNEWDRNQSNIESIKMLLGMFICNETAPELQVRSFYIVKYRKLMQVSLRQCILCYAMPWVLLLNQHTRSLPSWCSL